MPRTGHSSPAAFNPIVLTMKTIFLQRVLEAVSDGYVHVTAGTVPLSKSIALARKFSEVYGVHFDKNSRYRRKAAGLGNARLVLRFTEETEIDFMLLVSDGENAAHHLEKLRDQRRSVLRYREFELVRQTRKGQAKAALTWRWNAETMQAWRERVHLHTAHYDRAELYRDWFSLYRVPGFAGVRGQVGDVVSYWRKEWAKLRGDAPCPMAYPHREMELRCIAGITRKGDMFWPEKGFPTVRQLPTLLYVRKQKDIGEPLRRLVKSMEEQGATAIGRG